MPAPIAQSVERRSYEPKVRGSSPRGSIPLLKELKPTFNHIVVHPPYKRCLITPIPTPTPIPIAKNMVLLIIHLIQLVCVVLLLRNYLYSTQMIYHQYENSESVDTTRNQTLLSHKHSYSYSYSYQNQTQPFPTYHLPHPTPTQTLRSAQVLQAPELQTVKTRSILRLNATTTATAIRY